MKNALFCSLVSGLVLSVTATALEHEQGAAEPGPRCRLQVDNLKTPLGIDDPAPKFSWQLHDRARRRETNGVPDSRCTDMEQLLAGNADVWDSGRVASSQSIGVPYAGPALQPSTRYYWRVRLWNAVGKPYPASEPTWWETGLMHEEGWRAQWIGYETAEEAAVRHAAAEWIANPDAKTPGCGNGDEQRFAYRTTITLPQQVRFAALYRDRTGHGFSVGERRAGAYGRSTAAVEADALEEICARGCDQQVERQARTRLRSKRCTTWRIPTVWRRTTRRR